MHSWFILSAAGPDRPGTVSDLSQLTFDCDANLKDSAILLCSGDTPELERRLTEGARRLEWQNHLTVFVRPLEGEPRPSVPAPGTRLFRVVAKGVDRAGIAERICRSTSLSSTPTA